MFHEFVGLICIYKIRVISLPCLNIHNDLQFLSERLEIEKGLSLIYMIKLSMLLAWENIMD